MRTDTDSPLFLGSSIGDLSHETLGSYVRSRYPTLLAINSRDGYSIDSYVQDTPSFDCQITRNLHDFEYAEMARLAYYAMRNNLRLMRFPNTIISVPDHDHTPPVTIGG